MPSRILPNPSHVSSRLVKIFIYVVNGPILTIKKFEMVTAASIILIIKAQKKPYSPADMAVRGKGAELEISGGPLLVFCSCPLASI